VWVAAAARAALGALRGEPFAAAPCLDLLDPAGRASVPVRAAALLERGWALGETICDPGEGLDLTRHLVVWVLARWQERPAGPEVAAENQEPPWLHLEAGEGVGRHALTGRACLSSYARQLLAANLRAGVPEDRHLHLRVVLPAGRALALRTSNAAFGVVEGLALIGTRAVPEASAGPDRLEAALAALRRRVATAGFEGDLVLVIGENGLDLAPRVGLPAELLVKAGNWLGPLLVAAAEAGVRRLLLFGYQGKLLKLAGGIFHTHHHLADGRAEVLTALAALEGLSGDALRQLHRSATVEAALSGLEATDAGLADRLRQRIAAAIEERSGAYLARHGQHGMAVGAVLFDRARRIRAGGPVGGPLLEALGRAT
jgi:cobalt-precorrin-5B (C1)-methyltransferase